MPDIPLTNDELELLLEAIDSHAYWQLSDEVYRNSGYVREPGSDDPEDVAKLAACDKLTEKLQSYLLEQEEDGNDASGT